MHTHRYSESEYTHSEMLMRSHMDSKARHTCTPARRGSGHTRVAHGRAPAPAQDPGIHLPALTHGRGKGWVTGEQFVRPFKKKKNSFKEKKEKTPPAPKHRCRGPEQHDPVVSARASLRGTPLLPASTALCGDISATGLAANLDEQAGHTSSLHKSFAGLRYVSIRAQGWRAARVLK